MTMPALSPAEHHDEIQIRKVETDLQDAWNRHDAKAFARLWTEDGDLVNVQGWWWKGRVQIEAKLSGAHAFIFRESVLTHTEMHVRFLNSETAVVHVLWTLVGHKNPAGTPGQPRKGVETQVLRKQSGKWLIAALHNTDSLPEAQLFTGERQE